MRLNKPWLASNLKEAVEQLQEILNFVESEHVDEDILQSSMEHVYHHLNSAWNGRYLDSSVWESRGEEEFYRLRTYPKDIEIGLAEPEF